MELVFWIAFAVIYYIYDGYFRSLQVLVWLKPPSSSDSKSAWTLPHVTVLVTVYNEAFQIRERILNILESDYPADRLEVMIASDGSSDETDHIVRGMRRRDSRIRLFRPKDCEGKTATQNQAVSLVNGEILVFTDADTRFEAMFLRNMIAPFSDPRVGGVDGHLLFGTKENSGVSKSQGLYWNYELRVREFESRLGILAVASGACLAIRRTLFRPLVDAYGEDCVVPLDIVEQDYRMVHRVDAVAHDRMDTQAGGEFRARVRMTARNWSGTVSRSHLLNPFRHFRYAWALWSHKLLRWLSPVFLIVMVVSAFMLAPGSEFFAYVSVGLVGFVGAGLLAGIFEYFGWSIPVARTIFSLLLANVGFFVGGCRALCGHRITAYRRTT